METVSQRSTPPLPRAAPRPPGPEAAGLAHAQADPEARPRRGLRGLPISSRPRPAPRDMATPYLPVKEPLRLLGALLLRLHPSGDTGDTQAQSDFPAAAPGDGPRRGTKHQAAGAARAPWRPLWEGLFRPCLCFAGLGE